MSDIIDIIVEEIKQKPIWGNWYIKEKIGSGAFSAVYRVEAQRRNRIDVSALKIEPIIATDTLFFDENRKKSYIEQRMNQVEMESEIMSKLKKCPYIVTYEEEYEQELKINSRFEGYFFLIRMELLTCVYKLIHDKKFDFLEKNIIKLAKDIGRGIKAAHDIGVIHRDIKPANFFVSDDVVYKLGDFNISKQSDTARTFAGTDGYIAPEIYRAKSDINESYTMQSDIYSFGICLYQFMNNLYFPFEENILTKDAIEKRIRGEYFPKPKNASAEFGKIILKACEFDTSKRYRTIDEMLFDLDKLNVEERDMKSVSEDFSEKSDLQHYVTEHNCDDIDDNVTKYAGEEVSVKEDTNATAYAGNGFTEYHEVNHSNDMKYECVESDFKIKDGLLIKYLGNAKHIRIPKNLKIKIIGENAFKGCLNLRSINIPDTVTEIGVSAFQDCLFLESITIPDSITKIDCYAFRNCQRLRSTVILENVKEINHGAFMDCKEVKSITIPSSVKKISDWTFSGCQDLRKIIIPDSVTEIGTSVLYY